MASKTTRDDGLRYPGTGADLRTGYLSTGFWINRGLKGMRPDEESWQVRLYRLSKERIITAKCRSYRCLPDSPSGARLGQCIAWCECPCHVDREWPRRS